MADMTNEQAAEVLTERADAWAGTLKHFISGEEPTRRNVEEYTTVLRMGAAALRGPQPDPETGLVPCGCGKRLVLKHNPGKCQEPYDNPQDPLNWYFRPSWWVECEKGSLSIGKRYDDTFSEYCGFYDSAEEAITEANRAMGYKEDA
jgi:hypothetical protein